MGPRKLLDDPWRAVHTESSCVYSCFLAPLGSDRGPACWASPHAPLHCTRLTPRRHPCICVKTLHHDTAIWRSSQCLLAGKFPPHPFFSPSSRPRPPAASSLLCLVFSAAPASLYCSSIPPQTHPKGRGFWIWPRGCVRSGLQRTVGGL